MRTIPGFLAIAALVGACLALSCVGARIAVSDPGTVLSGDFSLKQDLEIRPGRDLVVKAGTRILALGDFRIVAAEGASVIIQGSAEAPVKLEREGGGIWGGIAVTGPGTLVVRYADMSGAPLVARNGATLLIEDSSLHDYFVDVPPIVLADRAASAVLRRVHVSDYYELNFVRTFTTIEDSLLERMIGDGIDFDNSPEGCVVRNCTIRNATAWNADAIDFGVAFYPTGEPSAGTVEACLIYDLTDKGVSVGEGASRIDLKNCLIHHVGIGISVKDGSKVYGEGITLVDNNFGINCYEERRGSGGGFFEGSGLVILGNLVQVQVKDGSTIEIGYSGIQGDSPSMDSARVVEYVLDADSQFMDRHSRDYRLRPESSIAAMTGGGLFQTPGYSGKIGASVSPAGVTEYTPTPVKVAIYGDSRDGDVYHGKIVADLANSESPDLVLHTGDMVADGSIVAQWDNFNTIVAPLCKIAPIYPSPGNHEGETSLYYDNFKLPLNDSGNEKWYAVRKENALFIVLNTNILSRPAVDPEYKAQLAWLSLTLQASMAEGAGIIFRFVSLHYPLFSVGSTSHPAPEVDFPDRGIVAAILEDPRWKVDMVFSGHNHFYERREHNGIAYFVLGGGGAPLQDHDPNEEPDPAGVFAKTRHYAILLVEESRATLEVRDLSGATIDKYGVRK